MDFDLEQAIDAFCSHISVARSQDDAIRQEVASHLRAKVDYYLNKRQLTEQEAFVLASQTMGDPNQFAAEMRDVHRTERVTGQAFSLLSVFALMMFILEVSKLLRALDESFSILLTPTDMHFVFALDTVLFLISYAVPISVVWLFGKVVKGYGKGILAGWIRKHASLLTTIAFVVATSLFAYLLVLNSFAAKPVADPSVLKTVDARIYLLLSISTFAFKFLFKGILAYLACWLISFNNKSFKAAFVTFACAMVLGFIHEMAFLSFSGDSIPKEAPWFLVAVITMSAMALSWGIACLLGWLVFRLRTRRCQFA